MKFFQSLPLIFWFLSFIYSADISSVDNTEENKNTSMNSVPDTATTKFTSQDNTLVDQSLDGKFKRLSITYINSLIPLDNSVNQLSPDKKAFILEEIKKNIMMKRFDYNPLPNDIEQKITTSISELINNTTGSSDIKLDQVTGLMNSVVVPAVVKYVEAAKEMRAKNLMTEQEKNSFITDKAKEIGVTAEQLENVMNSAFIFVPVISNYHVTTDGDKFIESITAGIVWWHITVNGDKTEAKIVVQELKKSIGMSRVGNSYVGANGYEDFAFKSMVKNVAMSLRTATQKINAFHLTGQVTERNGNRVRFDLGTNEGVKVDNRFRIVELVDDGKGGTDVKNHGWVVVTEVNDSSSKSGYSSVARIASGSPFVGALLHEYARSPFEIQVGYRKFNVKAEIETLVDIDDNFDPVYGTVNLDEDCRGFDIAANYTIGQKRQKKLLYVGVGWAMGFNSDIKNSLLYAKLTKKFMIRRVLLGYDFEAGLSSVSYLTDVSNDSSTKDQAFYYGVNGIFEFALSPAINIGTKMGWDGKGAAKETYAPKGFGLNIYLSFTPRGLPVNPIDMVRGMIGI